MSLLNNNNREIRENIENNIEPKGVIFVEQTDAVLNNYQLSSTQSTTPLSVAPNRNYSNRDFQFHQMYNQNENMNRPMMPEDERERLGKKIFAEYPKHILEHVCWTVQNSKFFFFQLRS